MPDLAILGVICGLVQMIYQIFGYYQQQPKSRRAAKPWPFARSLPIIISIALPIIFMVLYFRAPTVSPDQFEALKKSWLNYSFQQVVGQHFKDETIKLDGKEFIYCSFDNVDFVYNGTAPYKIELGNTIVHRQNVRITSDNPVVSQALALLATSALRPGEFLETNRPAGLQ